MEECCSVIGCFMVFENVLVNWKLLWGMYLICVVVKFNSIEFVKFMLMRGVDFNIMDFWDEILLFLVIIF